MVGLVPLAYTVGPGPSLEIKHIMKKLYTLLIATVLLAGCNTVSGIGRDVQKVGQVVTGAGGK